MSVAVIGVITVVVDPRCRASADWRRRPDCRRPVRFDIAPVVGYRPSARCCIGSGLREGGLGGVLLAIGAPAVGLPLRRRRASVQLGTPRHDHGVKSILRQGRCDSKVGGTRQPASPLRQISPRLLRQDHRRCIELASGIAQPISLSSLDVSCTACINPISTCFQAYGFIPNFSKIQATPPTKNPTRKKLDPATAIQKKILAYSSQPP